MIVLWHELHLHSEEFGPYWLYKGVLGVEMK